MKDLITTEPNLPQIDLFLKDEDFSDERQQEISDWLESVFQQFEESDLFKALTFHQRESGWFLVDNFLDFAYGYFLKGLAALDENDIREICLDIFPRKMSMPREDFEALSPVMTAFLTWCGQQGYISNPHKICHFIQTISQEMIWRSQDSKNWGMAKSMFCDLLSGYSGEFDEDVDIFIPHGLLADEDDDCIEGECIKPSRKKNNKKKNRKHSAKTKNEIKNDFGARE